MNYPNYKNHIYVQNKRGMHRCLVSMIADLGLIFHPDNDASDYMTFPDDHPDGKPCFTEEEQAVINRNLELLHEFYGEAVYGMSIMIWKSMKLVDQDFGNNN